MGAIVIEHVPAAELPLAWRAKLAKSAGAMVTVRIEEEGSGPPRGDKRVSTDDPAFGIWRDREDLADVAAYVRKIASATLSPRWDTQRRLTACWSIPMC